MRRKLTQQERLSAEAFERDMAAAPEATMQRRDFLSRTALRRRRRRRRRLAAAEPAARRGRQARGARGRACPPPANMPIDHFVVLMMENRSFDHYFGWLPDADGVQAPHLPRPGQRQRAGRDPPRLDARQRRVAGLRASRPRPLLGRRPRAARQLAYQHRAGAGRLPRRATTTSSRSATTTRATSASSTPRAASSRSTTASTAR